MASQSLDWEEKFGVCLIEIVSETLTTHFGKEATETIYIYLEGNGLKKKDIPSKVKIFSKSLRQVFGDEALKIENLITEKLCSRFNLKPKKENLDFVELAIAIKTFNTRFLRSVHESSHVQLED
jgi:hypothetical protein